MNTAKQVVTELLKAIPDDATSDDIEYRIYVPAKLDRAMKDIEEGRLVHQEEAERLTAQWLAK